MLHSPTQAAQWLKAHVTGTLRTDSRQVQPGDAFIAWPGAAVDGRSYVAAALQAGASACLVEAAGAEAFNLPATRVESYAGLKAATGPLAAEYFGHPSQDLAVLAVTGTNGKTSTAWWLAQALSALHAEWAIPCGMVGTLGVGRPPAPDTDAAAAETASESGSVVSTGLTTPDPVQLQNALRRFATDGLKACAIEASSIGIEEGRLDGTQVRVALFTNFTQDHLDYHGSMDAYWEAKRRLFAWPGLHSVVLNLDDVRGVELAATLTDGALANSALDIWTVSATRSARLQARAIAYTAQGMAFEVVEGTEVLALPTRLIGSYNVSNLLGVLGAMRALGVPLVQAVQACSHLRAVPGRMECLGGEAAPLVAVDYAHTPDALDHALAALRPMVQARSGKLWCVFGCGGDRDTSKRPLMGAIAAKLADWVVVTSDNPRSEKPEAIIAQILLGLPSCQTLEVQSDRAQAIAQTIAQAAPADVILLAGKGHEATQEIAGVKTLFSDREQAQRALQQWSKAQPEARP
jgi:UDP-N-acetylmuramoyl-L-alanyl-D-glutamate--2,6-diaminopimelate ligase